MDDETKKLRAIAQCVRTYHDLFDAYKLHEYRTREEHKVEQSARRVQSTLVTFLGYSLLYSTPKSIVNEIVEREVEEDMG